ncbi:MAG: hypothetical protein JWQ35_2495 [Bacteriovoracaceae bacterium]|nr:hypothetical protein [Bacteriovoracaceae bacterium]
MKAIIYRLLAISFGAAVITACSDSKSSAPNSSSNPQSKNSTDAGSQISQGQQRYLGIMNSQYRYALFLSYNDNGKTITNLTSATLTSSGKQPQSLVIDTFGDISYAPLTEARLASAIDLFKTQLGMTFDDVGLRAKMADTRQIALLKSSIPAGNYTLALTLQLSDGSSTIISDQIDLETDVTH